MNMYIIASGPDFGRQVYPCTRKYSDSLYPNLEINENSDRFYLSTSFSYLWTESVRPSWIRSEVLQIEGKNRVAEIVNHGGSEEYRNMRYFDYIPWQWLRENCSHRSQYNPHLVGASVDPFLDGWSGCWEFEHDGNLVQLRNHPGGHGLWESLVIAPAGYTERKKIYDARQHADVVAACESLAADEDLKRWQENTSRILNAGRK